MPSTNFGPVQPFGVRNTIIGQRGRSTVSGVGPRRLLNLADLRQDPVQRAGQALMHQRGIVTFDKMRLIAIARNSSVSSSRLIRASMVGLAILKPFR